jgi:hypothetical protein
VKKRPDLEYVVVFNEDPNGQSFYEKLGFILDDQWGNFVIREMRYRKPL